MISDRRRVAIILPLALWLVSGGVASFFVVEAWRGGRGLEAKRAIKARTLEARIELASLKAEKARWQAKVSALRADQLDADLLDERARTILSRSHPNDVVLMLSRAESSR